MAKYVRTNPSLRNNSAQLFDGRLTSAKMKTYVDVLLNPYKNGEVRLHSPAGGVPATLPPIYNLLFTHLTAEANKLFGGVGLPFRYENLFRLQFDRPLEYWTDETGGTLHSKVTIYYSPIYVSDSEIPILSLEFPNPYEDKLQYTYLDLDTFVQDMNAVVADRASALWTRLAGLTDHAYDKRPVRPENLKFAPAGQIWQVSRWYVPHGQSIDLHQQPQINYAHDLSDAVPGKEWGWVSKTRFERNSFGAICWQEPAGPNGRYYYEALTVPKY